MSSATMKCPDFMAFARLKAVPIETQIVLQLKILKVSSIHFQILFIARDLSLS